MKHLHYFLDGCMYTLVPFAIGGLAIMGIYYCWYITIPVIIYVVGVAASEKEEG